MRVRVCPILALVVACSSDTAAPVDGTDPTSSTGTSSSSGTTTTADPTTSGADSSTGEPIDPPPACGSLDYPWRGLIAGPGEPEHDADLEAAARVHDRLHDGLASLPVGIAGDVSITGTDDDATRELVADYLAAAPIDFADATGVDPKDVIEWQKATGAFAGVGIAADAYRYGTLRDQGYDCAEIEAARASVVRAIEGLHLASAVTGGDGTIARAITHREWPGASATATVPLFDMDGDPQPPEKTNGTFREDNSGRHPDIVWEDACSRDQLIGWAIAFGAIWEVVRDDPAFDAARLQQLQADAAAIARALMVVRPSGFDLEIWDPDGRPTPNGYLHENNVDGNYVGFLNGQHALMSSGIIAALAYVAEDPEIDAYLAALVEDRNLVHIAGTSVFIDFGAQTNHSNYNMAFSGAHLVTRYVDDPVSREDLALAAERLYHYPDSEYQVAEMGQALFDLIYAAAIADASAFGPTTAEPNEDALAIAIEGLRAFPAPPSWSFTVTNCDEDEIAAGTCMLADGTVAQVLGAIGHNDALVVDTPVPLAIRPPSNFYWRTNPYEPNGGGDGTGLPASTDFRFTYWLGRFTRRAE